MITITCNTTREKENLKITHSTMEKNILLLYIKIKNANLASTDRHDPMDEVQ
jgi:hypothetical protein